jgi:hypothetical protein
VRFEGAATVRGVAAWYPKLSPNRRFQKIALHIDDHQRGRLHVKNKP